MKWISFFSGVCLINLFSNVEASNFNYSGYIDSSYNYLQRSNLFTSDIFDRVYDINENGVTFQQGAITLGYQPPAGIGGLTTIIMGRDAYAITPLGFNANVFGMADVGLTVPEAYGTWQNSFALFKLGEIRSLSGIESYSYSLNSNFSRSILNGYAQGGSHIGISIVKEINKQITIIASSNNGWNTIQEPYIQNGYEIGLNLTPNPKFAFFVDIYGGAMRLTDTDLTGPHSWRTLFDFFGTFNPTSHLSLSLNYDYGFQYKATIPYGTGRAGWQGLAGYINYLFNPQWQTSFRAEIFEDGDGYRTGVRQNWRELTLTLVYTLDKVFHIQLETRRDFSNVDAFFDKNGTTINNNQQSYALNFYYTF
jgi:hypothetical protein